MAKSIRTEVALIGGGPACISAAIQLKRSGIETLVISEDIGGNVKNANFLENLLGFPEGIKGKDFTELVRRQAELNSIQSLKENALELRRANNKYEIRTDSQCIEADYVLVGTGTTPDRLGIQGEEEAIQGGFLFYEAHRVIPLSNGKDIIIIGSGDAAYDCGIALSVRSNSVRVMMRNSGSKCLEILKQKSGKIPSIKVLKETIVKEISIIEDKVLLKATAAGNLGLTYKADYILVAIGRKPNIDFLAPDLKSEFYGMDEKFQEERNIHYIGDVGSGNFRQVAIAMGNGIKAAMKIRSKMQSGIPDGK